MFQMQTYAVANDEQRDAAIAKWRARREEQNTKSKVEGQELKRDDGPP
jgi:hypothetical protein